jgi:branched-chain amino acid transport system permease protein
MIGSPTLVYVGSVTASIVALASLPFWASQAVVFVAGLALTSALFALSWNLLFGYAGISSFGHAAFFSIGAYFTAVMLRQSPETSFLMILAGAIVLAAAAGFVLGYIILPRLTGVHFAILTLAIGEVTHLSISASRFLGSEDGISGIARPSLRLVAFEIPLQSHTAYYLFILVVCVLFTGALWWLCHGPVGRVLKAIRQDPERCAFVGIHVTRYRVLAFTISAGIASLAGALAAPWTQIVTPEVAFWMNSAQPMLNSLLGGTSAFFGPVIGSVLVAVVNYQTRTLLGVSEMVVGGILLAVVLLAPGGIASLVRRRRKTDGAPGQAAKDDRAPAIGARSKA